MLCRTSTVKAITIAIFIAAFFMITSFYVRHFAFVTIPTQTIISEEDTIHIIRMVDVTNTD